MQPVTLLIAAPGILTSQHLESRTQEDKSGFVFLVSNLTNSLVKLTNIQLTLLFDFQDRHLTVNGVSRSIAGQNPLVLEIDDLLPGVSTAVTLQIVANVDGTPSPVTAYPMALLATYDTEPWPAIVEPVNISGGAQMFYVVPD